MRASLPARGGRAAAALAARAAEVGASCATGRSCATGGRCDLPAGGWPTWLGLGLGLG